MILRFDDHEGDPVAVLSEAIVAVSVGTVNGPARITDGSSIVTLIHLKNGGPLMARQSFEDVLAAWEAARAGNGADQAERFLAHPGVIGWLSEHFNPSALKPEVPAPWAPKGGAT